MSIEIKCDNCDQTIDTEDSVFCQNCFTKGLFQQKKLENKIKKLQKETEELNSEIQNRQNQK